MTNQGLLTTRHPYPGKLIIVEGIAEKDDDVVSPETQTYQMSIKPSGEIIYEMNEESK